MEEPAPAFKNYLAMIRSGINRLDGFIKDILDYSQNARREIQIEPINFQELITESQNNLSLINGADRLKTKIEIENTVPFNSDRIRIGILLNNLLSNSIKYQDHSKESSIVSIRIVTSAEKATIRFSDNGIGIEAKHLDKIFDMFYRASENSKGSGLGLYIAKETIAKLGGTIKVESVFGTSTTFEIILPNSKS
jgi:signal transduction histidine kinase